MNEILDILKDQTLTYEQKVMHLARAAENTVDVLNISEETQKLRDEDIICDLFEGNAPYRPRYIVPDYEKFMQQGSQFLNLTPPEDLYDAIHKLLILYRHVPSITSFPVYIGNIDKLLNPFVSDDEESYNALKHFLRHIDRTLTDSFCHANIGPEETLAGRLILKAERELQDSIPNVTLKYGQETSEDFALDAVNTALVTAKPSFANDELFRQDFQGDYAIASCYNGLPIGGGSYTLVRMRLNKLAQQAENSAEYLNEKIPSAVKQMVAYMDERVRFLIEESAFFETSFLVKEGLIDINNFTAMFGVVGLAEAVNHLLGEPQEQNSRFGHHQEADDLGEQIIATVAREVQKYKNEYMYASQGQYLLHAQVGLDTDQGSSPGCRIPIGEEPDLHQHVLQSARFHKYFPSGIGDVFAFDATTKRNPKYILDIIRGGFKNSLRYFSPYATDCDVIRITGYLVKRSEIEKLDQGEQVLRDTVVLGLGNVKNQGTLDRKIRQVSNV